MQNFWSVEKDWLIDWGLTPTCRKDISCKQTQNLIKKNLTKRKMWKLKQNQF